MAIVALLGEGGATPNKLVSGSLGVKNFAENKLVSIVQDSFGKNVSYDYVPYLIRSRANVYFRNEDIDGTIIAVGAAVVIPEPGEGIPPHLATLAVQAFFQDEGIGKGILAELLGYYQKLNWRSKQNREPASRIYSRVTKDIAFFTAASGIDYNGYFVNHTLEEKQKALRYMAQQPSHFKE